MPNIFIKPDNCPTCHHPVVFKEGTKTETGKKWQGYFCQNKDCKNVVWVPLSKAKEKTETQNYPDGFQVLSNQLSEIAKDIKLIKEFFASKETKSPDEENVPVTVYDNQINVKDIPFGK